MSEGDADLQSTVEAGAPPARLSVPPARGKSFPPSRWGWRLFSSRTTWAFRPPTKPPLRNGEAALRAEIVCAPKAPKVHDLRPVPSERLAPRCRGDGKSHKTVLGAQTAPPPRHGTSSTGKMTSVRLES